MAESSPQLLKVPDSSTSWTSVPASNANSVSPHSTGGHSGGITSFTSTFNSAALSSPPVSVTVRSTTSVPCQSVGATTRSTCEPSSRTATWSALQLNTSSSSVSSASSMNGFKSRVVLVPMSRSMRESSSNVGGVFTTTSITSGTTSTGLMSPVSPHTSQAPETSPASGIAGTSIVAGSTHTFL